MRKEELEEELGKTKQAASRPKPYTRPSNYYANSGAGPSTTWQPPTQATDQGFNPLNFLMQQPLTNFMQAFQNPFNQGNLQQPFNQQNAQQQQQQNVVQPGQQPRRYSGPNSTCFGCQGLGHFARDCPLKPAAQGAPPSA